LIFDPAFLISIAFMAWFNFLFDQSFNGMVLLNSHLSFLYLFQFNVIIPVMDTAILLATGLISKRFTKRA